MYPASYGSTSPQHDIPYNPPADHTNSDVSTEDIDAAAGDIQESLDQGWLDWDVTQGDLQAINNVLDGLSAEERQEVISKFSDDTLNHWTDEISGSVNGLSASERENLHNMLAESLDAEQLERVYQAYGDRGERLELATAVANRSDSEVKVNFIERLAPDTTEGTSTGIYISELGDTEGRAIAEVLASLSYNQTALNEAYDALNNEQLNAVIEAATDHTMYTGGRSGIPSYSYDPELLTAVIDAAATSSNADLKARVFQASSTQLEAMAEANGVTTPTIVSGNGTDQVREAMTELLLTDVNGVVESLEVTDRGGEGLALYLEGMLEADKNDKIGELIAQIQRGNDLSQNPLERFTTDAESGDAEHYDNAERLGYFLGATQAAIESMTDDREAAAGTLKSIILTANTAAALAKPVTSFVYPLSSAAIDQYLASYTAGQQDLQQTFAELTFPQDPNTGKPYDGVAETAYDAAVGRVLEANR